MKPSLPSMPALDTERLTDLLIDLQVGFRKISMYGLGHSVVAKIVSNVHERLNELFNTVDALIFGIGKDELLVQGRPIATGTLVIQNLSRMFHNLNLIAITFHKGLTEADLLAFFTFIIENRTATFTQDDDALKHFHETVASISLQAVSFKEALQDSQTNPVDSQASKKDKGNPWQGLLKRLSAKTLPADLHAQLGQTAEGNYDLEKVAWVINALYPAGQAEADLTAGSHDETSASPGLENREVAIVEALKAQFHNKREQGGQTDQIKQEMAKLFSMLHPEARDHIFRASVQEGENQTLPLEGLLEFMPPTLLPEVLNKITISNESVSGPTVSLLKKMLPLSESDEKLKRLLETKVENHKGLFDELFINRADRDYYPASYRSKLDKDLIGEENPQEDASSPEENKLAEAETDHHLALILLEILENPRATDTETERCLEKLKTLLTQGFGEETRSVLVETVHLFLKHCSAGDKSLRLNWIQLSQSLFTPEMFRQILTSDQDDAKAEGDVAKDLISVAGVALFPMLLNLLEVESHLSIRKQIIQLVGQGGPDMIPHVVEQLSHEEWYIVRNMLVILRDLKAEQASQEILACLRHDSEKVRLAALQALGSFASENEALLVGLSIAIEDPDERVFKTAVSLLAQSRHPSAAALFRQEYQNVENGKDSACLMEILNAIARSGPADWRSILQDYQKGLPLWFLRWGRQRSIRKALHQAIIATKSREKKAHVG